jgi:pimeloyl-ACP methyl ester carboxylesterase
MSTSDAKGQDTTVVNEAGEKLRGVLHRASRGKNKDLVIVCHGFNQNQDRPLAKAICLGLASAGFYAFRFDFSGYGKSDGNPGESSYAKQVSDLKSVISHLHTRQGLRAKGVVGHSMGGTVAILYAAQYPQVQTVVALAPRIIPRHHTIVTRSGQTLDELIASAPYRFAPNGGDRKEPFEISREYLQDIKETDVLKAVRGMQGRLVIIRGTQDKTVDADEIWSACEERDDGVEVMEIPEADHCFAPPRHRGIAVGKIVSALRGKSRSRYLYVPIFVAVFGAAFLLVSQFLRQPLRIEYGISWAVFSLFATLNLQYVSLGNRLRDLLAQGTLPHESQQKTKRIRFLLVSASVFFMITIIVLGLRICLQSFYPESQGKDTLAPPQHALLFLWLDWVIVSTFMISLPLRGAVFFCSYGPDPQRLWTALVRFVKGGTRKPADSTQASSGEFQSAPSS